MDSDATHMIAASKVPMPKPGEFKLWRMRIEHNGVNTGKRVHTANGVNTASSQVNAASSLNIDILSDAVICAFLAPRGHDNRSRDVTRKTMQVETHTPLVETPNSLAMVPCDRLGGYDWSYQAEEGPTNYALMAYSTPSTLSSDSKVSNCFKSCLKAVANIKFTNEKLLTDLRKTEIMVVAYKEGLKSVKQRDRDITKLQRRLDLAKIEKEGIQLNINKLENASKSLNKIIECQIVDNCKKRLGYNVVPPPHACLFLPPKSDLFSIGLEELFNEPKTKKLKDKSNEIEPESVRKHCNTLIIEDWVSDDEEERLNRRKSNGKKDKTSGTLKSFITRVENVMNLRVKVIKCNNETEFKNMEMNQFCEVKGSGPNWLFDIDALTKTMNYQLVVAQSNDFSDNEFQPSNNGAKRVDEDLSKENECNDQREEDSTNSTNIVNTITSNINVASSSRVNIVVTNLSIDLPPDPNMPSLEDIGIFKDSHDDGDVFSVEVDFYNLDSTFQVSPILTTRIHKDHPLEQVIRDLHSAPQTRRMSKNLEEHGLVVTVIPRTDNKDLQNCLFACLLNWNPRRFSDVKKASTPMETSKPLLKDEDGEEVDVHMYSSMICSLMYLTSSMLDIMFAIKTVNDDIRLQALIDGKKVIITEASIRHDLKLNDAEVTSCLSNVVIFKELAKMGSTMASAIICLANNQKFNFSKYILDNLKKNLEAGVPFLMFPRKEKKETEVSPTKLHTEDHVPTTSNDPLLSEMKSSQKAKIVELESRVEKLEEENMSLTKELKSFNTKVESLAIKETVVDKEESSKQRRKIADIDADAEVNLENVYNLDMAHKETVLSMQDVTDVDVKEVDEEMVEVITTAKITVDEVSTANGEVNAANEEPVSAAPTNITTAQPNNAEKQKLEEQQEAKELKKNLETVPDDEDDVFVNVTPLSSKPPTIVDYKIYKEGKKENFQIIRAKGNHQMYLAFSTMLKNLDREDLKALWKTVKDRFKESQPKEVLDIFLWHTLKVMFEHTIEDNVWKLQK
uniref:Uncharacterized protein n=1 Tax=Tanacetum cinerariifolium TaxID=118510 RepID=A0A699GTE4_TANCI|nr:hypothetical protein [Tanacetum cinerariifolium]